VDGRRLGRRMYGNTAVRPVLRCRGSAAAPATLDALIATARLAVAESAQALRRMADGTYGTCERCATRIPVERLEVMPQARFCLACQRSGAASVRPAA